MRERGLEFVTETNAIPNLPYWGQMLTGHKEQKLWVYKLNGKRQPQFSVGGRNPLSRDKWEKY